MESTLKAIRWFFYILILKNIAKFFSKVISKGVGYIMRIVGIVALFIFLFLLGYHYHDFVMDSIHKAKAAYQELVHGSGGE